MSEAKYLSHVSVNDTLNNLHSFVALVRFPHFIVKNCHIARCPHYTIQWMGWLVPIQGKRYRVHDIDVAQCHTEDRHSTYSYHLFVFKCAFLGIKLQYIFSSSMMTMRATTTMIFVIRLARMLMTDDRWLVLYVE